jgi:drug/metabolite transporter (DMT)-like permease
MEAAGRKRLPHLPELCAGAVIIVAVWLLIDRQGGGYMLPGAIIGLFSAAAFAAFGVGSKTLGGALHPVTVSLCQNLVVAIILAPLLPFFPPAPVHARDILLLIALGVVATALMHQLYFYALRRLSASTCSGFAALEPVYAILLAALIFGDPVTGRVIVSMALIIAASLTLLRREG